MYTHSYYEEGVQPQEGEKYADNGHQLRHHHQEGHKQAMQLQGGHGLECQVGGIHEQLEA